MNSEEYQNYVNDLAHGALRMGETPRSVATKVIVATENVYDDKLLLFNPGPYVDDPPDRKRLWPKDVLTGSDGYPYDASQPDDLRALAVSVLKADLYQAMMGIENDTARPWGET